MLRTLEWKSVSADCRGVVAISRFRRVWWPWPWWEIESDRASSYRFGREIDRSGTVSRVYVIAKMWRAETRKKCGKWWCTVPFLSRTWFNAFDKGTRFLSRAPILEHVFVDTWLAGKCEPIDRTVLYRTSLHHTVPRLHLRISRRIQRFSAS